MNKSLFLVVLMAGVTGLGQASGLPKQSIQVLMKALQDPNAEVRTAAAQALLQVPDDAEPAVKAMESALIASADANEQEALVKALVLVNDSGSAKRLSEALANPQFTWGNGAKAKAVEVVGQIGQKKMIKWLTDIVGSEQEPAVRAAAAKQLGAIGAPPKKDKK